MTISRLTTGKIAHQKPLPDESVYKHLGMLANYCSQAAKLDIPIELSEAFQTLGKKLGNLQVSRAVCKLLSYGE